MDQISFNARINIDYGKVRDGLLFDNYFDKQDKKQIKFVLKRVRNLADLKEPSVVSINPRLDNNQLNFITSVEDKTGKIKTVISERSARKMAVDDNFANRFVSNIRQAIVNTEITRKELKKIKALFKNSKTLQNDGFLSELPYFMLLHLNKGHNPADRIIYVLNEIQKNYPKEKSVVSIKKIRKASKTGQTSKVMSYFTVKNSDGEKVLPIQYLLKDPIQNLFA